MSDKYWNKTIETMPRKQLRELQLKKLKAAVKHCYDNSAFYKRKLKAAGITPESIKTFEDLQKIPFTVKTDLRDNYPMGLVAVDSADIVEIHASSGTTGNPIIGAYTRSDMEAWQEVMARSIYTAGGKKRRRHTHRLRLRPIHRRLGFSLWRPKNRNRNRSSKRRHDPKTNKTHERLRRHHPLLHSKLRSLSCRNHGS